mmetsp:Transcript_56591/g.148534  ORF Transcript_56591/g.148534 Transcript_56591/m.148534 type:complete len:690 (-) Transcript_56591:644-2713(-)
MPPKGLARKADGLLGEGGKRMLLLDPERCKPNMPAHQYLSKYARMCGGECITVQPDKSIKILEEACAACLNRAKHCPGDAVRIINLPSNLDTNLTHRYGANAFKLHGLPTPRVGAVLGLLGTNGIGKSTALNVLAGRLKPNLGSLKDPPGWADIMTYHRGSELQNYFKCMLEDQLGIAHKVQLDTDFVRKLAGKKVGEVLKARDQRGAWEATAQSLDLMHLLEREIQALSGGELQRFAIAITVCREADVYMFDEASSFLDVRQRMTATDVIRSLVTASGADENSDGKASKEESEGDKRSRSRYVIVVEHDLAVLDYMSDYICCLYGEPGAYGVVTKIAGVRNGINNFLAGYIPAENMRFRAEELSFHVSGAEAADQVASESGAGKAVMGQVKYPGMSKTLEKDGSTFTLHVAPGHFKGAEIIGLLGENGCGKTTFMEMLAGAFDVKEGDKPNAGESGNMEEHSLAGIGVSYKRQHYAPRLRKFQGTVQELFEKTIQRVIIDRLFRLLVLKPLQMDALEKLYVKNLSGGELQRVAITICLGAPASVYLLDEPSAGLDCEQRIIASKVIRRWVVNHMQKTAFIIDHDFVMASALADRVIVYTGQPGVECTANTPQGVVDGFNSFLKMLDVTFRRDPTNFRPRVNKKNSSKDREQKAAGQHFVFDAEEDPADRKEEGGGGGKKKGGKAIDIS